MPFGLRIPLLPRIRCLLAFLLIIVCVFTIVFFRQQDTHVPVKSAVQCKCSSGDGDRRPREIVIYNKIPKTGSTSVVKIFAHLSTFNNFEMMRVNVTNPAHFVNTRLHKLLVDNLTNSEARKPLFLHGHFAYINFGRFGSHLKPIYINLLRDPLERLASRYYFLRFGDDYRPHLNRSRMINNTERWQTFDQCVKNKGKDCNPSLLWSQVPLLCGSDWYCSIPGNKMALYAAKKRLVDDYLLVGVTENFKAFMLLLEALLPRFATGLLQTANVTRAGKPIWHTRKTTRKYPVAQATRDVFKAHPVWLAEQELYDFARREFSFRWNAYLNSPTHNYILSSLAVK